MKRADLIRTLKGCGATGDKATFTRLYIENRISRVVADQAWRDGVALKRYIERRDGAQAVPDSRSQCLDAVGTHGRALAREGI